MASGVTILFSVAGGIVLVGLLVYVVMIYNGLVRLRKNIDKSWSNIEVLLKQRHDEIPKLVDTVREYMDYERDVLQDITEARTRAEEAQGPEEQAEAEGMLQGALGNLFAVAEDYPELKANESFQQLQERISALEEQVADRREFYNDSVNTFNIRINQIPYNVVANMMDYTDKELFEVSAEDRQDVDISDTFDDA